MSRCVLLCASPEFVWAPLRPDDYIIACDGGYRQARGRAVALFVGDMDSAPGALPEDLEKLVAPVEKDDTDAGLAVRHALSKGFSEFLMLGALGGRLDHTLGNLQLAGFIADCGGRCTLRGARETVYTVRDGRLTLRLAAGRTVSVFAFGDKAEGVTLRGMKYPLCGATLSNTFPIGVSNVVQSDEASVEVERGTLLVVCEEEETNEGKDSKDECDAAFVAGKNPV